MKKQKSGKKVNKLNTRTKGKRGKIIKIMKKKPVKSERRLELRGGKGNRKSGKGEREIGKVERGKVRKGRWEKNWKRVKGQKDERMEEGKGDERQERRKGRKEGGKGVARTGSDWRERGRRRGK